MSDNANADGAAPFAARTRVVMRLILAIFYAAAGVAHLRLPDTLLSIMPDWVPYPREVIFWTGLFEFAAVAALLSKPYRTWAGIAMAVYAICVWPANFKHAVEGIDLPNISSSWWYHGPRLAMQPVIVWWALFSSGAIDWPWQQK